MFVSDISDIPMFVGSKPILLDPYTTIGSMPPLLLPFALIHSRTFHLWLFRLRNPIALPELSYVEQAQWRKKNCVPGNGVKA